MTSKDIQGWAPVAAAVATSFAVLLALFGEQIRAWRQRPRLALRRFDPTSADGWVLHQRDGSHMAFVRLRLQNIGRSEAREVEVVIESLTDETPAETAAMRTGLGRDMTAGLAGRQLKWADRDPAAINIPAGTVRRFDVISINDSDAIVTPDGERIVPIRVGLFADSASGRHMLASTAFTLTITIAGSNFKPSEHKILLSFSGVWPSGIEDWTALRDSLEVGTK